MRVLIFIGLKIMEIVVSLAVMGVVIAIIAGIDAWVHCPYFWASFEAFFTMICIGVLFCWLCWIIKQNWEWAGKITNEMRQNKK